MNEEIYKGMVFKGKCESLGQKGDGVFRIGKKGFVIIVPKAVVGQEYTIEVVRLSDKFGFGVIKDE